MKTPQRTTDKVPIGGSIQIRLQTFLPLDCRLRRLREGGYSFVQRTRPSMQPNPPMVGGWKKSLDTATLGVNQRQRATRVVVLYTGKASTSQQMEHQSVKTSPYRSVRVGQQLSVRVGQQLSVRVIIGQRRLPKPSLPSPINHRRILRKNSEDEPLLCTIRIYHKQDPVQANTISSVSRRKSHYAKIQA